MAKKSIAEQIAALQKKQERQSAIQAAKDALAKAKKAYSEARKKK